MGPKFDTFSQGLKGGDILPLVGSRSNSNRGPQNFGFLYDQNTKFGTGVPSLTTILGAKSPKQRGFTANRRREMGHLT